MPYLITSLKIVMNCLRLRDKPEPVFQDLNTDSLN